MDITTFVRQMAMKFIGEVPAWLVRELDSRRKRGWANTSRSKAKRRRRKAQRQARKAARHAARMKRYKRQTRNYIFGRGAFGWQGLRFRVWSNSCKPDCRGMKRPRNRRYLSRMGRSR